MRVINLEGQRFGRLILLERLGLNYRCKCDCGNETIAYRGNITSGITKSCGCYRKEIISRTKRKPNSRLLAIGRYYRRNALTRGIAWSIQDIYQTVLLLACHYCGDAPAMGIDRVDNTVGYTLENSVPCCRRCNAAKNDMSFNEFKQWLAKAYGYLSRKEGRQ